MRIRFDKCVVALVCLLFGCGQNSTQNIDPFYRDKGGGDYARLPLIKPYEVWYLNEHYNLLSEGGKVVVQNVKELDVVGVNAYGRAGSQDIIVQDTVLKGTNNGDWFCLDLKNGDLSWFSSEEAFTTSIENRIGKKLTPVSRISDHFQSFRKGGLCEWFPNQNGVSP